VGRVFTRRAEALGYKNKTLSGTGLPGAASLLQKIIDHESDTPGCLAILQAVLLGKAGFIDSGYLESYLPADYGHNLAEIWSQQKYEDAMLHTDWELFKIRPGNHPVVRILALSQLLIRFRQKGLAAALLDIVRQTKAEKCQSALESALMVDVEGTASNRHFLAVRSSRNLC
jgi:hypothetical protein